MEAGRLSNIFYLVFVNLTSLPGHEMNMSINLDFIICINQKARKSIVLLLII